MNLTISEARIKMHEKIRCSWCQTGDRIYIDYHDQEWGVPVYDDRKLFEFLTLEGAQAGLSWITILKRREGYRKAFDQFDVEKISRYKDKKIEQLMQNKEIIRNRLKIMSTITNAQAFIKVQKEFGSFSNYQWNFFGGTPKQNKWQNEKQLPAESPESIAWSKDLKKRGFKFVGPTIIYAHMQAVGLVNDHVACCFRYRELK